MRAVRSIGLIGIRCDRGSSFARGSADAPAAIRAALHCDSGNDFAEHSIPLYLSEWFDAGDLIDPTDHAAAAAIHQLLGDGYCPIVLGGDHAITRMALPGVKQFLTSMPSSTVSDEPLDRPLVCLQFDAHPDLYDALPCVSGADPTDSHAVQFSRLLDPDPHGPQIDLLLQVGIRTATTEQTETAAHFGVKTLCAADAALMSGLDIAAWVSREVDNRFGQGMGAPALYISMDLDGLDPAFAPGVAHIEPGGLSVRQVIDTIQSLKVDVVAADIVELLPSVDTPNQITARVAAKIAKEIAATLVHPTNVF